MRTLITVVGPLAAGAPGAGGHSRIATADVEVGGVTVTTGGGTHQRGPAELLVAW